MREHSRQPPNSAARDPALDALIIVCSQWVYAQALHEGHFEPDAAEIAQIAALRLIRWPAAARHPRGKWLMRLYSQCLLEMQRMQPHALALDEQALEAPSPGDQELLCRLQEALTRLPPREAYVIRQCKLGDCTPSQIAEEWKRNVNYIHLLDSRGRRRLMGWLRQDREESGENS